jgi:hypothetical protein
MSSSWPIGNVFTMTFPWPFKVSSFGPCRTCSGKLMSTANVRAHCFAEGPRIPCDLLTA